MGGHGNPVAQLVGLAIIFLGLVFAFIALARVYEDVGFIRELIFKFNASRIHSLWFMAIILIAVGYYVYKSE